MRVDGAYANLVLPSVLAEHGLAGRDAGVRHRAGLRHACGARHLRRDPRRLRRPAADARSRQGPRRAAPGHPPAALHAGAAARRDQHHRRPGPGQGDLGRRGVRQRGAAPRRRAGPRRRGSSGWRRTRLGGADALRGDRLQPPPLGRRRAAPRAGRRRSCPTLLARRQRPPRVTLVARPGRVGARGAARRADALLAVRRRPRRGRPRRGRRRWPRAAPACRTRAPSWSPRVLAAAEVEGPDDTWVDLCAGPGGQGRAAGRRWPPSAGARPGRRGAAAPPGPAGPARAGAVGDRGCPAAV